jgi:predicted transcriptional regulator
MKIALFAVVLAFIISVAEAGQLTGSRAPDFTLHDQRDKQVNLHELEGQVVMLIASDAEGEKQNDEWKKAIGKYRNRVLVFGAADVRKVPFFLKGKYKRRFQKDPASILLDWDGVIFKTYGLAENVSNIVVIDKKGIVRYFHSGKAEPAAVEELSAALEKSLE